MSRKTQNYLALLITAMFVIGLFVPYREGHYANSDRTVDYHSIEYGWNLPLFLIGFALCTIVVCTSFSNRITLRLLVIRIALALLIPLTLITILNDVSYMLGRPHVEEMKIGFYLTYIATFLTFSFGLVHFRTSYPKYKQMLKKELDSESDLLDS
jgi:hypothetical protein